METRANYALVGLFTLAVIAAGFGFVYWFHRGGGVGERAIYRVVFDGPVAGIRTGAPVLFNGIPIGQISDLSLNASNPRQVVATIAVAKSAPVRADTRVGVAYQGLTGIAALAMRGGDEASPPLQTQDGSPPLLTAEVGSTQDVMQAGRDVLRRLDEVLLENQVALRNTIKNMETFSEAMARNAGRVDDIVASAERSVQGVDTMINGRDGQPGEVQQAVRSFKGLAENLDQRSAEVLQSVKQSVASLEQRAGGTMDSVKRLADNLDKRTADIAVGVTRFSNQGLVQWERLAVDARRAANELERAIRNFERNPSRLIWGGSLSDNGAAAATPPRQRRRR